MSASGVFRKFSVAFFRSDLACLHSSLNQGFVLDLGFPDVLGIVLSVILSNVSVKRSQEMDYLIFLE